MFRPVLAIILAGVISHLPCPAQRNLLLVSNRVPWTVAAAGGVGSLKASAGGLVTALARTHERSGSLWVGWPGDLTALDGPEREKILGQLQEKRIVPVEVSAAEVERYYEGFSNGLLWPVFHAFPGQAGLGKDRDWEAYVAVNERFAAAAAAQAAPGGLVWIHDYQLMLVPQRLRELRPDLRIGFFLHIPFPPPDAFQALARSKDLLQGVLGADLAGFQTPEDQAHFAEAAGRILGADAAASALRFQGRATRLGTFPIGIDFRAFAQAAGSPTVTARAAEIQRNLGGRTLILGVDRLDYSKGIDKRLLALERFLEQHPERRGTFVMIQVAAPSRENVPAYKEYRQRVDAVAARVNGAFGTLGWVPVHLLHQGFPFEEVVALYRAAQVMLVTSERDGMNLVAKEFCAAREDDSGVLILSRFAGAARELPDAILVNPYDLGAVAEALDTALRMPADQVRHRMRALRRQVAAHDVYRWSEAFLRDLEAQEAALDPAAMAGAERVVLVLDYDGTLVPFAPRPEDAKPDPELLALLGRLAGIGKLELRLVSGRSRENLEAWFGHLPFRLHAEHGLWRKDGPGAAWAARIEHGSDWKQEAKAGLADWCRQYRGVVRGGEEPFRGLALPPGPAGTPCRRPGGRARIPAPVGPGPGPGVAGRLQSAGAPGARGAQGAGRGKPRPGPGHPGGRAGR